MNPLTLETDSREYDVLYHAAVESLIAKGASVEIGVRMGGGSELIMRATANARVDDPEKGYRTHIGIDPWGDLPYILSGRDSGYRYSDEMRQQALKGLYHVAHELDVDLLVFNMRDTDFFRCFQTGVPFYRNGREQFINQYSLVHFDGPHNVENVIEEMEFFAPRMSHLSWWVFDDVYLYDHASIESRIFDAGFEPMDNPYSPARLNRVKASYRKVR